MSTRDEHRIMGRSGEDGIAALRANGDEDGNTHHDGFTSSPGAAGTTQRAFVSPFSPLFSKLGNDGTTTTTTTQRGRGDRPVDGDNTDTSSLLETDPGPPHQWNATAKDRWFQQLSLNGARKVSIVVRVDSAKATTTNDKNDDADDADVCLFPLVLSKESSSTSQIHPDRRAPLVSAQEIVVVNPDAFGTHLQLPAAVTVEHARLVSLLSRRVSAAAAATAATMTTTPPAKGTSTSNDNPTEDWIRSYRFSSVVWSSKAATATTTTTPSRSLHPPPADTDCWARLCKAMAGDVTMPGSIARRTVVCVGGGSNPSDNPGKFDSTTTTTKSKVAVALSPSSVSNVHSVPAKTTTLFGTVATESVAHVLAANDHWDASDLEWALRNDPTPIIQRYGLLGLTCCYILQQIGMLDPSDARHEAALLSSSSSSPSSIGSDADNNLASEEASPSSLPQNRSRPVRRKLRLTLSILEVADEDLLYDLLKLKPFARESAVQLKHSKSIVAPGASNDRDSLGASASTATLVGLTDTPIDSLRTLGRCVRRAFTMAYHARRTKPRGTLLAILKVWDVASASSTTSPHRHTAVQFVDLAQVVPEEEGSFWRESQKPRNSRLRQSITALGAALRQVLLKEAGNSTAGSYRQHTLTQVLSRDLGGGTLDSRIVLLANLSPLRRNYAETMATIRFVSSIVTRPGDPLLSPFDKHHLLLSSGDGNPNDNHTKTTSSPTSRSSDDADNSFLTSASLTDEALLHGALLRSVVADPRQRMAKIVRPSKPREQDSVNVLVGSDEPYTPTNYMSTDPGEAAAAFEKQAEELAKRGEAAASAVRGATDAMSPRDAPFGAATESRGYDNSYFVMTDEGHATSPLRGRHIETGFGSDTRSSQSHVRPSADGYSYGEPSPLTTDTGGRSAGFEFQRQGASAFPLQYLNQGAESGDDDLLSAGYMPDAHSPDALKRSTVERLSTSNDVRFGSATATFKSADKSLKGTPTAHEGTIRSLEESIRGLQYELQQSHDDAASELAREREHGDNARYQLEGELEELRRSSQRKDDDLRHLQRRVDVLRHELEAQQQASADRLQRLQESFEADGNVRQERLEAEIEHLRLAIRNRDDSIADLQSLSDGQRQQLQRRLDDVLADLKSEREKTRMEQSALAQSKQDLEHVLREKDEKEASLLRLQVELDEARNELPKSVERIQHDSDERARQLEELCLQYREEADQCRNELSLRDEELQRLNGALACEQASREMSDDEQMHKLLLELEEAKSELNRRDARIREQDAAIEQVESGRQEVLAIADEAIATQAELEKRIQELDMALSAMGDRTVPKEQYEAAESAYERVSQELREARDDLLRAKTDVNDGKVRMAEVQFSLQSVQKERDHLAMRDAENQRELARMRSALQGSKSAGEEVERLSVENRRLLDELHQAQSLRSKYELELEQELSRREEEVERSQEEVALIKNELALAVAEHSAATELYEQQIQDLRTALEDSERELSKLVADTNRSNDATAKELEESKRRMSIEVEQLQRTCDRRSSEAAELSRRLHAAQQEKDDAVAKAASMKRALASFQDSTRTKVQTFVHHRSETKALLERTLEENDFLVRQNRQLQAALEDLPLNPVGPMARELDDAVAKLSDSRSENAELRAVVQQLAGTIESLRGQVERAGPSAVPRPADRHGGGFDVVGGVGVDDGRAADMLRSLNDLVESRRLDDLLRPYRHESGRSPRPSTLQERNPLRVPGASTPAHSVRDGTISGAADLVANLALAAKKSVDQSTAQLSQLKTGYSGAGAAALVSVPVAASRSDRVSDLSRRVRVLESHRAVLDGVLSFQGQQYQKQQQQQQQQEQQRSRRSSGGESRGSIRYGRDELHGGTDADDEDVSDADEGGANGTTRDAEMEGLSRRVRALERRLEWGWTSG